MATSCVIDFVYERYTKRRRLFEIEQKNIDNNNIL